MQNYGLRTQNDKKNVSSENIRKCPKYHTIYLAHRPIAKKFGIPHFLILYVCSFHGNYSFFEFESNEIVAANFNFLPNKLIFFSAETISGRKLFKGGNSMRKYGILKKALITRKKFFFQNDVLQ